jgi:hypothetical protein
MGIPLRRARAAPSARFGFRIRARQSAGLSGGRAGRTARRGGKRRTAGSKRGRKLSPVKSYSCPSKTTGLNTRGDVADISVSSVGCCKISADFSINN